MARLEMSQGSQDILGERVGSERGSPSEQLTSALALFEFTQCIACLYECLSRDNATSLDYPSIGMFQSLAQRLVATLM